VVSVQKSIEDSSGRSLGMLRVGLVTNELGEGGTTGWMVAILAPESSYTADLLAFEQTFLLAFGSTVAFLVAIAVLTLNGVRRGLARITSATTRMRNFDFAPKLETSAIRDVDDVIQGLERAKTVVRAMGKYVPIDLVRRLYSSNEEPKLGGELQEISLMFTDIAFALFSDFSSDAGSTRP
jgi:adenylate cyclase